MRRTKKRAAAEEARRRDISAYLQSRGARLVEDGYFLELVMDTPVGLWHFSLRPDATYSRFDNPLRARHVSGCNGYSGKLNWYYFEWEPFVESAVAIADLSTTIDRVLKGKI